MISLRRNEWFCLPKEREDLCQTRLVQLRAEIDKGSGQIEGAKCETHDGETLTKALQASKSRGVKTGQEKGPCCMKKIRLGFDG